MIKTAYIVQGVGESTGCRFITEVLIKCGIYGRAGHSQEFQRFMYHDEMFKRWVESKNLTNLVVRQSYPHGRNLPSLYNWYYRLKNSGFDKIYTILTTRSWPAQITSTVAGDHLKNNPLRNYPTVTDRIQKAYTHIFSDLARIENGEYCDFIVLNLGDISTFPKIHLQYLFQSVNIIPPEDFDYDFVKKDIDVRRLKQYEEDYLK